MPSDFIRDPENQETPLFDAARKGDIGQIRLLIQSGASVKALSRIPWEHSAIDEAAANQQEEALRELVQAGASDPRITSANGEALPADGGEPIRVCRAYGENILAEYRDALRSITSPRSAGFFEEIDFEAWRNAYPTVIQEFDGYMNDSAATILVRGVTAGGAPTRWVYQMRKDSGAWKVHQTWPRE